MANFPYLNSNSSLLKIVRTLLKVAGWCMLAIALLSLLLTFAVYQFKDKLIQLVVSELNKDLNTKVLVEKIDIAFWKTFPYVSLEFHKIEMKGSDPSDAIPLLKADRLFLSFNIKELYGGHYEISKTSIENADLHFIISPNGSNNFSVLKKKSKDESPSSLSMELEKVSLKNVNVTFENRINEQTYDIFCREADAHFFSKGRSWNVGLTGGLFVHKISVEKKDYLARKELKLNTSLVFDDVTGYYTVSPSDITIGNSLFSLEGKFGVRSGQDIELRLSGKETSIHTILALLPADINQKLGVYKSQGNVYFNGTLKGKVDSHYAPEANFIFGCRNVSFWHPDYLKKVEGLSFKGMYSSGRRSIGQTSYLKLEGLEGNIDNRDFSADFELKNFADPYIKFSFNGSFNLESLVKIAGWKDVEDVSGELSADLFFEGKKKDLEHKNTLTHISSFGNIQLRNTHFTITHNKLRISDMHTLFSFDNNSVHLHELSAKAQGQDILLKGYVYNHLTYMAGIRKDLDGELQLQSDFLDLEKWFSMAGASTSEEKSSSESVFEAEAKLNFQCNVKKVIYKTFTSRDVRGKLTLQNKTLKASDIFMKAAGGSFALDGQLDMHRREPLFFEGKAKCSDVKVDSLFLLFDNFGQDFLVSKNLKGHLNVTADLYIPLNKDFRIMPKSSKAQIHVSIKNGELNEFAPLQKLSKFIDAKDLYNVRFQELKNSIRIENERIFIPEMEIKSNLNSVSVLGTQGFDGSLDYKLKVSLKNFKKKDKDEAFGAIKEDGTNTTLFLTLKGTTQDFKVAYDSEAVKAKLKDSWKQEKEEFKSLFKTNDPIRQEKNKPVEIKEDEYIDIGN